VDRGLAELLQRLRRVDQWCDLPSENAVPGHHGFVGSESIAWYAGVAAAAAWGQFGFAAACQCHRDAEAQGEVVVEVWHGEVLGRSLYGGEGGLDWRWSVCGGGNAVRSHAQVVFVRGDGNGESTISS